MTQTNKTNLWQDIKQSWKNLESYLDTKPDAQFISGAITSASLGVSSVLSGLSIVSFALTSTAAFVAAPVVAAVSFGMTAAIGYGCYIGARYSYNRHLKNNSVFKKVASGNLQNKLSKLFSFRLRKTVQDVKTSVEAKRAQKGSKLDQVGSAKSSFDKKSQSKPSSTVTKPTPAQSNKDKPNMK